MFMSSAFRACRGQRVEKLLSIAAFTFSQLVGVDTEIIFDNSRLLSANKTPDQPTVINVTIGNNPSLEELNAEITKFASDLPLVGVTVVPTTGTPFLISSARPNFNSTDDKLISYLRKPGQPVAAAPPTTSTTSTTVTATATTTTTSTTATTVTATATSTGTATTALDPHQVIVVTSDRALAGELYSMGVTALRPSKWIALLASLIQIIAKDRPLLQAPESDIVMEPKEVEKIEKSKSQKVFEDWCFQFIGGLDQKPVKGKYKCKCRNKETSRDESEIVVVDGETTRESELEKGNTDMDLSSLSRLKLDG